MSFHMLQPPPSTTMMRGSAPLRGAPLPSAIPHGWAARQGGKCSHAKAAFDQQLGGSQPFCGKRPTLFCRGLAPGMMELPLDRDTDEPLAGFDSIRSALDDLAAGKFVVVLDDESRENEGDLIIAADKVTPEAMAYMVEYTSGVICISMEGRDLDRLRLPLMINSAENEEAMYTAFTVTVDLKEGISTGISAADRAKTIRRLADPTATAADFRRPGHIFPLRYRAGGVLVRPGHTEAGVDLARLAGCYPAGVLCEIVDRRDGSMARTPELREYARAHNLKCITIADLIRYRLRHERLVVRTATAHVRSPAYGPLTIHTYRCALDDSEHLAVVVGGQEQHHDGVATAPVPVHVHRESCVSDLLVDAPASLLSGGVGGGGIQQVLTWMSAQGQGVVVYMRPRLEGRPSLAAELLGIQDGKQKASGAVHERGPEDLRVYGLAAQIIKDVGLGFVATVGDGAEQTATALASCGLAVQPRVAGVVGAQRPTAHSGNGNGNGIKTSMASVR